MSDLDPQSAFLRTPIAAALVAVALSIAATGTASAHCDAMDGPVITEAARALDRGDVQPLLKWVPAGDQEAIRAAFADARKVRGLGPEARRVADTHFFETLVRLHRASEGAPFTGIQPAGHIKPVIAAADQALERGDVDALVQRIQRLVDQGIRTRYEAARKARANAGDSTAAGREYVDAYVQYVHYAENLEDVATEKKATHGEAQPSGDHRETAMAAGCVRVGAERASAP